MLKDKVIVVAGANGRIGKALCKEIIKHKGIAVACDLNDLAFELEKEVFFVKMNITQKPSLQNAIDKITQKYGRIDGFVNSAYPLGKHHEQKAYYELEFDEICEVLSVHLGGFILAAQEFVKFFKKQGYGNIINLSSIMGVYAPKFENYANTTMQSSLEYSVIKAGINHLGVWLAKELFNTKIRVNSLASGGILDNQPQSFLNAYRKCCANKGMLDAKDICGTICFLLSDLSEFITGQTIVVADGWGL